TATISSFAPFKPHHLAASMPNDILYHKIYSTIIDRVFVIFFPTTRAEILLFSLISPHQYDTIKGKMFLS
ncbi:MAG: hypothetical protein IIX24_02020, partial [Peptococcaceae bacterium]|nr:hypothetical protein [Peptococcaceae bacterium]